MKKQYTAALALGALALPTFAQQQPNIIVFLVDDMGWQDTSVPFHTERTPLNDRYRTPNMERMASMGVKFTQAYAAAVSSPSRCSIMTGMNPARHGVTNWIENGDQNTNASGGNITLPTWNWNGIQPAGTTQAIDRRNSTLCTSLPTILSANGYRTIHCGKGNFGAFGTSGQYPDRLGFDVNIAGSANGSPASYLASNEYGSGTHHVPGLEEYYAKGTFLTEALTLEAIKAMNQAREDGKPFYLYFSHYAIHTPYEADTRFTGHYTGVTDPMLGTALSTSEVNRAALIEGMDKSLGDVLDYLATDETLAQNTIVLFMSDNGGQGVSPRQGRLNRDPNYPLRGGKGSSYMGGVREPMMVLWPGVVEGGTVNDNRVIIEDFFPTVLEMAGVSKYTSHQTVDGKSFVDILRDPNLTRDRVCIWHYPNRWGESADKSEGYGSYSAIMKGDYHMIYFWENQERRLYNIKEDISEMNNLADAQPELLQALAEELTDSLISYGAARPMEKATGTAINWPRDAEYIETVAQGDALNILTTKAFILSDERGKAYYTIQDNRADKNFYWTIGEHQGYKAVQSNNNLLTGDDFDKQLFYFTAASDNKHFLIHTADGRNVGYEDGVSITSIGKTTTERAPFVQYDTDECTEFELIQIDGQTNRYGIRAKGEYLNTRGCSKGDAANMAWVLRTYSGLNASQLSAEKGSQFRFVCQRTEGETEAKFEEVVANGEPLTVRNANAFRMSTAEERHLYTIQDNRNVDFYWTLGEHQGYKAVQCNNQRTDDDTQLFYFTDGEDAKHFCMHTADGKNIDYLDGVSITSIGKTTTEAAPFVQYGTETEGQFELIYFDTQTNRYGLRIKGEYLNDRGTSKGDAANMAWVIRKYSGLTASTASTDKGSQYLFTYIRTDKDPENGIDSQLQTPNSQLQTPYDLQGRPVPTPSRGLYIIGGRKTVVR